MRVLPNAQAAIQVRRSSGTLPAMQQAFSSLIVKNQDYNPECVICHVTGFGYTGGFKRPDQSQDRANVQCEMCHGAGAEHAAQPAPGYGANFSAYLYKLPHQRQEPEL